MQQSTSIVNPGEVAGILVGASAAVRELREDLELAFRTPARVLIAGEYGVGKRRLAELIHRQSLRGHAPFVSLRCIDLDANLEPRLFRRHNPVTSLQRAEGGTVFFDGVDCLSRDAQRRLQHFVATGRIHAIGARRVRRTNIRVVSSTTIPLMQKLATGSFSEELYYQLNTIYLPIRPLRERLEDIEPLLEYFVAYYARRMGVAVPRLGLDTRAICRAHHWPGNMRQLQTAASLFVTRSTPHDAVEVLETAERLCRQYADA